MATFWDTRADLTPRRPARPPKPAADARSVTEFAGDVKRLLRDGLPSPVRVAGEVSYWTHHHTSGHRYFTLKDDQSTVNAKMWKSAAARLSFEPGVGDEVVIEGYADFWNVKGTLSIVADKLTRGGEGELEAAFQQLKAKLEAQGLFDPARKRPLPRFPLTIALVTSPQAAGFADVLETLGRVPFLRRLLYPVAVQGEAAAGQIAEALRHLGQRHRDVGGIDLILLGRGGGSREDLWAFNEEVVARAIAESPLPILTGIGHKTDLHIADLVADVAMHTPTAAAGEVVAEWLRARDVVGQLRTRLRTAMRTGYGDARSALREVSRHELFRRPRDPIDRGRQRLDEAADDLDAAWQQRRRAAEDRLRALRGRLRELDPAHRLRLQRQRLAAIEARLERAIGNRVPAGRHRLESTSTRFAYAAERDRDLVARRLADVAGRLDRHDPSARVAQLRDRLQRDRATLDREAKRRIDLGRRVLDAAARQLANLGPDAVLSRGYTLTLDSAGRVVRSAADVASGDELTTRTADGDVRSRVV